MVILLQGRSYIQHDRSAADPSSGLDSNLLTHDAADRGAPAFSRASPLFEFLFLLLISDLTIKNTPFHQEVVSFCTQLCDAVTALLPADQADYGLACEHEHSLCVLIANKNKYMVDGKSYLQTHSLLVHPSFLAPGLGFPSCDASIRPLSAEPSHIVCLPPFLTPSHARWFFQN